METLKESNLLCVNTTGPSPSAFWYTHVYDHHMSPLLYCMLQNDITCESFGHSAIQALGYFIHNIECAV